MAIEPCLIERRGRARLIALLVGVVLAWAGCPVAAQPASATLAQSTDGDDPPTTVVVTRCARRGCETVFERLWQQTWLFQDWLYPPAPACVG